MRELIPGVADVQLRGTSREGPPLYVAAFVVEGERTTLVDTGWEESTDELLDALETAAVVPDRVVLTHDGRDHYGGIDGVMARYEPELVVPAGEPNLHAAVDYEPDRLVEDRDRIGEMEVVTLPGHSPAPASLYLPERRALIAADVLDGADRRGLPAGHLVPPVARYNEDHAAAAANLPRLLDYDIDAVLVFHGSHVVGGAGEQLARLLEPVHHYGRPGGVVYSAGHEGPYGA